MHKLLTRHLADFNSPRYDWWDRETPGTVLALAWYLGT
jgi:hypothetical protein